ncbi:putative RNase H-like HicB family nuclease [Phyllobacterium myrsinacearum]|uniref:type II toxin-antitoxin system HicB family antitoxin n=1 Tax=Phyllobacterium myrsinacearum TaxID=28101 RepID=UPI00102A20D0|nr:type II toxin-antitoxin system HicB family antitoxin [Phyllobacterium myrsinacearum]RZS87862.1 putative RNase H-like HicB family nuclease [Phyllobacterium myrsinacearum]
MTYYDYSVIVSPLSSEDGGGFIAYVPDLPGCMSDGNTPEEAVRSAHDAIAAWLEAATDHGLPIPPASQKPALAK